MKLLSALTLPLILSCAALLGCGSNGTSTASSGGGIINPPPVHGASYSNASIKGTYTILLNNGDESALGSFTADGAGNISNGTITKYATGDYCTDTLTGTYSIQSDGSGTATLNVAPAGASPCDEQVTGYAFTGQIPMDVSAAQQGAVLDLLRSDQNGSLHGSASLK